MHQRGQPWRQPWVDQSVWAHTALPATGWRGCRGPSSEGRGRASMPRLGLPPDQGRTECPGGRTGPGPTSLRLASYRVAGAPLPVLPSAHTSGVEGGAEGGAGGEPAVAPGASLPAGLAHSAGSPAGGHVDARGCSQAKPSQASLLAGLDVPHQRADPGNVPAPPGSPGCQPPPSSPGVPQAGRGI